MKNFFPFFSFFAFFFLFGFVYAKKIWPTKPNCQFLRLKNKKKSAWFLLARDMEQYNFFFHKWNENLCLCTVLFYFVSSKQGWPHLTVKPLVNSVAIYWGQTAVDREKKLVIWGHLDNERSNFHWQQSHRCFANRLKFGGHLQGLLMVIGRSPR